jgi:CRISPR-associated endonuclease/helicase Cas3
MNNAEKIIIGHTSPDGVAPMQGLQSLRDHTQNVMSLVQAMWDLDKYPLEHTLATVLAQYHDLGKATDAFQKYMRDCENLGRGTSVDHKKAGATFLLNDQRISNIDSILPGLLARLSLSHHGGLKDTAEQNMILKELAVEKVIADNEDYVGPQYLLPKDLRGVLKQRLDQVEEPALWLEVFARMVFSSLVDADTLDTAHHFDHTKSRIRKSSQATIGQMREALDTYCQALTRYVPSTTVNKERNRFYQDCISAAELAPGVFTLTAPTGVGKTLSSLAFALKHAHLHGKRRVIVGVPFVGITDQTAAKYNEVFQNLESYSVLEHHSGIEDKEDRSDMPFKERKWRRLASENWDAPLIVSTTVQLLESMFTNQNRRIRKFHNMIESVVVLDEAQSIPRDLLQPTLSMLRMLVEHYGCTIVFCTATQPAFQHISAFSGLKMQEINSRVEESFKSMQRTKLENKAEKISWSDLAAEIAGEAECQVLTIVNTKSDAQKLTYELISREDIDRDHVMHLSTRMTPLHRQEVLEKVKLRLKDGLPILLVSTQLIEAGIDVDFPVLYRALAPLDSIIQASGRCNREGRKKSLGRVVVFRPEEGKMPPHAYKEGADITGPLLREGEFGSPTIVEVYFTNMYRDFNKLDRKSSENDRTIQENRNALNYEQVGKTYRLIDNKHVITVVADHTGKVSGRQLFESALAEVGPAPGNVYPAIAKLRPYSVQLTKKECQIMRDNGLVIAPIEGADNELYEIIGDDYDYLYGVPEDTFSGEETSGIWF